MLSDDAIQKKIAKELDNSGWELKDGKLTKLVQFQSFVRAIDFVLINYFQIYLYFA